MTRAAWLPLLSLLATACVDRDEQSAPECLRYPDVETDASGDLAVRSSRDRRVLVRNIFMEDHGSMRIDFGDAWIRLRRPARAGVFDLAALRAQLCSARWVGCTVLVGRAHVTVTEPDAFEATVEVDGTNEPHGDLTIAGTSRLFYRETENAEGCPE